MQVLQVLAWKMFLFLRKCIDCKSCKILAGVPSRLQVILPWVKVCSAEFIKFNGYTIVIK